MVDWLSKLDKKLLKIVSVSGQIAAQLGFKAYLVGGPVRDLMLKRTHTDMDITVEGNGIRVAEKFAAQYPDARIERYLAFKTATVYLSDRTVVDFATARKETYKKGGAFPKVEASHIKDDLSRRDFTINAMAIAIDPAQWGNIVDPFKGREDLRLKRIRVLHEKSFLDDPTRIVRAARFKTRFNFSLERKTMKILKEAISVGALETIKPQRYMKEFNKILKEPRSQEAIQCLEFWDALKGGQ